VECGRAADVRAGEVPPKSRSSLVKTLHRGGKSRERGGSGLVFFLRQALISTRGEPEIMVPARKRTIQYVSGICCFLEGVFKTTEHVDQRAGFGAESFRSALGRRARNQGEFSIRIQGKFSIRNYGARSKCRGSNTIDFGRSPKRCRRRGEAAGTSIHFFFCRSVAKKQNTGGGT